MNLQTIVGLGKKGTLFKILELCQKIFSTVIVQLQQHERERSKDTDEWWYKWGTKTSLHCCWFISMAMEQKSFYIF